jgi:hypothetical protein
MLTRIWLTYKQHRFETIALIVVCLGLAAAALIEAYRLNSMNVPMSCFNSWTGGFVDPSGPPMDAATAHCNSLVKSWMSLNGSTDMNLVQMLLIFAPLLGGIVLGAPLVAREIEQGTAPLSWALSGSRRRWLLGKVLAGVLLLVPLMLAVGITADVLTAATHPGLDTHAAFEGFAGRGVIVVFWALAAFAGTFALGTLMGRTLPALIVALLVCFFVRVTWDAGMSHFILAPFARQEISSDQNYNGWYAGEINMPAYGQYYMDGKPWNGDYYEWSMAHPVPMVAVTAPPDAPADQKGTSYMQPDPSFDSPSYVQFVIPGNWYWNVVAVESAFLLLGSLLFGGIAMVWVDRRRPY